MDNLTHSFAGALIGQLGLKRKTGLAMPTLVIAANLPDIDAFAILLGGHQHLALRRGMTHGPIAMVLLPVMLWGIMLAWNRWRPSEKRVPVDKRWLLALAFIGTLSHPALDWLNSYGVRFLEPFSSRWSYGDTIFIIDIWIWMALGCSFALSFRRERRGQANWQRPAWMGFAAICAYILANGFITARAERLTQAEVERRFSANPLIVVANPVPVQFWRREMLWRDARRYGQGAFALPNSVSIDPVAERHNADKQAWLMAAKGYRDAEAFLFWSRMPVLKVRGSGDERRLTISDQRFNNPLARDRFTVAVPWKDGADER